MRLQFRANLRHELSPGGSNSTESNVRLRSVVVVEPSSALRSSHDEWRRIRAVV
jgi:hypothetical protein